MSETLSAVQPTATPSSTMSGVLQAMAQQQQSVSEDQRGLADRLKDLQEQLEADPSLENDPKFATHVAWLMQDWPKFSGTGQVVQVSPLLHAGLNAMAGQYPGMSNPQMASMLQQTAAMGDRQLVADIRNASVELGGLPAEQQTSFLISAGVNALEARAAQAGVVTAPQPSPVPAPQAAPAVAPSASVGAPEIASESVAQIEPSVADLGQREEAPSFVVAGDNELTAEELAARGMSADHAAQLTPPGMESVAEPVSPVAGSVVAESTTQATAHEAAAETRQEAVEPGRPASGQDMDYDNQSAGHAEMNIPFNDGDGAPSSRADETVDATRGEPEAQATQSAQEASQTAGEEAVQAGMSQDQEEDIRNRDMNNQQEAQNRPPEQQQGTQQQPKQAEQANRQTGQTKTQKQTQTKEVEPEAGQEQQTQASAQAQPATQPAQAATASLAGHAVSKVGNFAKSWLANQGAASDQRRINSLVATVDGNIRMADQHYQDLKQAAAPFFQKMKDTARQEGLEPAELMASMGEGGKHHGLWQEFTKLRLSDERVGKPYNDLANTLQDMRRNLGSLQSEAAERGAAQAESVIQLEERVGNKAKDMEDVPGRDAGQSLIKSIGGALERLMEKVKARFLAHTQGREQGRDTSPSMGA
ncbi:hypothetical protein OQ496_10850 [Acetobacter suratthaniensis]|uniref:Uncharacterized protein n=1 Tax=Acetobacter suratthaniensis TaxID=1502841 RepID=A0ABS3LNT0_9PROT|nr:hypothetical protein [Acetobacter suratthaniensis]MBO1329026.1 hypothetical protein [Acetobacter suratthaniensis]MCX2566953.1 hypothetical protein [Acetobacter suratthaniensis]